MKTTPSAKYKTDATFVQLSDLFSIFLHKFAQSSQSGRFLLAVLLMLFYCIVWLRWLVSNVFCRFLFVTFRLFCSLWRCLVFSFDFLFILLYFYSIGFALDSCRLNKCVCLHRMAEDMSWHTTYRLKNTLTGQKKKKERDRTGTQQMQGEMQ